MLLLRGATNLSDFSSEIATKLNIKVVTFLASTTQFLRPLNLTVNGSAKIHTCTILMK